VGERNMESNNLTSPSMEISRPGIGSLIVSVFTKPSEAFKHLHKKTDWLIPFIIIAIVGTIMGHFLQPLFVRDMTPIVMRNMEKYRAMMSEEQYNQVIQQMENQRAEAAEGKFKWQTPVFATILPFIFLVVITTVCLLTGNFIFGGKAGFWLVMNVVAFAALVGLLGDIVRLLMVVAKDSVWVYTGLGILKPIDDGTFLFYLLRQVDLFTIWRIVVTCIGLGVIYNMKPKRFAFVLFPIWIVFICIIAFANMYAMGSIIY